MAKDKITPRNERFCQEYVADPDLNASRAYSKVYPKCHAPDVNASRLLSFDKIQARIKELEKPLADRLGATHEYVIKKLLQVIDMATVPEDLEKFDPEIKAIVGTGQFVFDSRGANGALQLLMKHKSMITERVDHTTKGKELPSTTVLQIIDTKTKEQAAQLIEGKGRESSIDDTDHN